MIDIVFDIKSQLWFDNFIDKGVSGLTWERVVGNDFMDYNGWNMIHYLN